MDCGFDVITGRMGVPKAAVAEVSSWIATHPRLTGSAFFLGGLLWDATTRLQDASRLLTHAQLIAWLTIASIAIVVECHLLRVKDSTDRQQRHLRAATYTIQFSLGAMLGAYIMHYSYAASWGPSVFFLLTLAALSAANEFLSHYTRPIWLRIAMLAFCTNAWLLFAIPVLIGQATLAKGGPLTYLAPVAPWLNPFPSVWLDLMAACGAMLLTSVVGFACDVGLPRSQRRARLPRYIGSVGGVLTLLAVLDILGVVPPVPLGVVKIDIYHEVARVGDNIHFAYRRPRLTPWRHQASPLYLGPDDKGASCYTPVFAPPGMVVKIAHIWEHWSTSEHKWTRQMYRPMQEPVRGGRALGYRTWSSAARTLKQADGRWLEGWWRCRVETMTGREIARKTFWLDATDNPPPMLSFTSSDK